ncbi:MAG: ABC transporter ATP-binding protein [Acetivibrio ethanolgignens]
MKRTKYYELTKLFKNLRKDQFFLLVVCTSAVTLSLYFTYQIQGLVDLIVSGAGQEAIRAMFLKLVLLGGAVFVLGVIQTKYWHIFRYKVMNQMRTIMYEQLLKKEAVFFDGWTTGDVVSAIMSDGSLIAECAGTNVLMFFLNVWQLLIITGVLLWKSPVLGLLEIIAGGVYFVSINRMNKQMRSCYKAFSGETAELNQRIVEDTKAIFEIKTLNEKSFFRKRFEDQLWNRYFPAARSVIHIDVLTYGVNQFINIMFPMLILVVGGMLTYQGFLSIGMVILFYTYTQKLVEPLNNLSDYYRGTQIAVGAADRIYEYLFTEKKAAEGKVPDPMGQGELTLSVDIFEFGWKGKGGLLKNIHEEFKAGDKIFVQGESGAGKSTFLKLLCGFYPVREGEIRLNGCNIAEIEEEELFRYIKIQFQESIILEGSLRRNLELGQSFSEEEIWNALEMVNLSGFAKENGLEHLIAENGKNLSGGQKQRLALARVLLRKPPILILDEATSALDEENEQEIIKNVNRYVEETGAILILTSHREALKKICNKTLFLNSSV